MTFASSRDASPNRCQLRFSRTSFMAASSSSVLVIIVPCARKAAEGYPQGETRQRRIEGFREEDDVPRSGIRPGRAPG
jgi:hypothetical protein